RRYTALAPGDDPARAFAARARRRRQGQPIMQIAADTRAAAQSRIRLELLANLVRKDLKVKYKSSALGFAWSLANPVLYLAVFTLVSSLFGGIPSFPVYFMSGLLVWNFFNLATLTATGSVVGNANLVKKVPFPGLGVAPALCRLSGG